MKIVVKLFHEIIIKSRPVRKLFTKQLHYNLENLLKPLSKEVRVYRHWDRIDITLPDDISEELWLVIKERLQCVPGIDFLLVVDTYNFEQLNDITDRCVETYADGLKGKSFCVRVKMWHLCVLQNIVRSVMRNKKLDAEVVP